MAHLNHLGGSGGVFFLASVNDFVGKVLLGALGRGSKQSADWKEVNKIEFSGAIMYILLLPPNTPHTSPRHAAPIPCGRPPHCSSPKRLGTRARLRTALPSRSRKSSRPVVRGVRAKRVTRRVDLANMLNINVRVFKIVWNERARSRNSKEEKHRSTAMKEEGGEG